MLKKLSGFWGFFCFFLYDWISLETVWFTLANFLLGKITFPYLIVPYVSELKASTTQVKIKMNSFLASNQTSIWLRHSITGITQSHLALWGYSLFTKVPDISLENYYRNIASNKQKKHVCKDTKNYEQIHRKHGKFITVTAYNVVIKIIKQEKIW